MVMGEVIELRVELRSREGSAHGFGVVVGSHGADCGVS